MAMRNLELVLAAVLEATLVEPKPPSHLSEWEHAMEALSQAAWWRYRRVLYEDKSFVHYFEQATPIDAISEFRIGSRPSVRPGGKPWNGTRIEDLRAIPWVFSWNQSRHMLPSWFPFGSAVEQFTRSQPNGLALLQRMYREFPWFHVMVEFTQISLGMSDMHMAAHYAALVKPRSLGRRIFAEIDGEFRRTKHAVLTITGQSKLLADNPVLSNAIRLRNPYVDPISLLQVRFLKRRRQVNSAKVRRQVERPLALTINGIASGMRHTG